MNTFEQLLSLRRAPLVNENDSVSVEEILHGDNDCLSAEVAALIGADALVILTDIDGLYDSDPRENPQAGASAWWKPSRPRSKPWPAAQAAPGAPRYDYQAAARQTCHCRRRGYLHHQRRFL